MTLPETTAMICIQEFEHGIINNELSQIGLSRLTNQSLQSL